MNRCGGGEESEFFRDGTDSTDEAEFLRGLVVDSAPVNKLLNLLIVYVVQRTR